MAKYFAKLDAVHGYFRLALKPKSSLITIFLLPKGKLRYLRAPMGLKASSDKWLAHMTSPIRPLLKKGAAWIWIIEQQEAFEKIKKPANIQTCHTSVRPKHGNYLTHGCLSSTRYGFCSSPNGKEDNETGTMRIQRSHTNTPTIHFLRTQMHGSPVRDKEKDFYLRCLPHFKIWTISGNFWKGLETTQDSAAAQLLSLGKDQNPEPNTPLAEYASAIHTLSFRKTDTGKLVMQKDGAKIVVPQLEKGKLACQLHQAHQGIGKTYKTARQQYSWPNMKNKLGQIIASCQACQARTTATGQPY